MAKIWTQYFEHIIVKEKHTVKSAKTLYIILAHIYTKMNMTQRLEMKRPKVHNISLSYGFFDR